MKKIAVIGCGAYMNTGYGCPYFNPEELASLIEEKTSFKVILGSHNYH